MEVVATVAGIVVIVIGLHDMFHTLLHPTGQGRLSRLVLVGAWRISRATGHRLGSTVGPLAMVVVILLWVLLQLLGWALIYLPHVPEGFMYSSGVDPSDYPDVLEAVYLSAVTLSTLGYGDMVATDLWIRTAAPLQALTGFALLTAALTWFTQIYPPLSRRRSLALELKGLADSDWAQSVDAEDPAVLSRVLDTLAAEMLKVRIDFAQHSEGFYFQEREPDFALARQLPYALQLRDVALASSQTVVRRSGRQLSLAIEELSSELDDNFLHTGGDPEKVFAAYAADHGQEPRA
ncbi:MULTISPECIES: potassium channel family protein [Ornithinimicrobium]|uniref:potassium channel family protein n=1 Tax=Ornithinimicrobium TaxID=125287 RepID=UPI00106F411C|nr:potassium channel family protein [Ornithinimicrobium flavum]